MADDYLVSLRQYVLSSDSKKTIPARGRRSVSEELYLKESQNDFGSLYRLSELISRQLRMTQACEDPVGSPRSKKSDSPSASVSAGRSRGGKLAKKLSLNFDEDCELKQIARKEGP